MRETEAQPESMSFAVVYASTDVGGDEVSYAQPMNV